MRRALLLLIGVSGCNWAFGIDNTNVQTYYDAAPPPDGDPRIDLDRDGIKDVEDPCIAAWADELIDGDADGLANNVDPCPLDTGGSGDADGDGVGDACDPSPTPGDRMRCHMAFTDPELDLAMWRIRDNADSWVFHQPRMLVGLQPGSIVADWSFEGPTETTFRIVGDAYPSAMRFGVLARADRTPSAADVGCFLVLDVTWSLVGPDGTFATLGLASTLTQRYMMQVTLSPRAPDGVTLRCTAQIGSNPAASVSSTVALPFGTLGFLSMPRGTVRGITIYERADAR